MKRIAKLSFFYSMLGLLLGAFYREFTKINGFKGLCLVKWCKMISTLSFFHLIYVIKLLVSM